MILLSDKRISDVITVKNSEGFVSLRGIHTKILIDESRSQIASRSDFFCYVRKTVAEKLIKACDYLPDGYNFLIKEGYRPLSQQKKSFESVYKRYKDIYQDKSESELYEMVSQYVAPIDVAGHPTGGAVDITLIKGEEEVFMGTYFNEEPGATENRTYLYSEKIKKEEKENREILIKCMEAVGMVNYPPEWWHWSYGDKYWAYIKDSKSIYGPIDEEKILINNQNLNAY